MEKIAKREVKSRAISMFLRNWLINLTTLLPVEIYQGVKPMAVFIIFYSGLNRQLNNQPNGR
jgi:hypothetical protein